MINFMENILTNYMGVILQNDFSRKPKYCTFYGVGREKCMGRSNFKDRSGSYQDIFNESSFYSVFFKTFSKFR